MIKRKFNVRMDCDSGAESVEVDGCEVYVVSHLASGWAIDSFDEFEGAEELAKFLDTNPDWEQVIVEGTEQVFVPVSCAKQVKDFRES